jgi:hypothetical protein
MNTCVMKAGIGDVTTFRFRYSVLANRVSSSFTIPLVKPATSTGTFAFTGASSSEEDLLQELSANVNRIMILNVVCIFYQFQ